jgi:hypothetical protein
VHTNQRDQLSPVGFAIPVYFTIDPAKLGVYYTICLLLVVKNNQAKIIPLAIRHSCSILRVRMTNSSAASNKIDLRNRETMLDNTSDLLPSESIPQLPQSQTGFTQNKSMRVGLTVVLVLILSVNLIDLLSGGTDILIMIAIDLFLILGIWKNIKYIQALILARAIIAPIFWTLLSFIQFDIGTVIIVGIQEFGFSLALLLLSIGNPRKWRVIMSISIASFLFILYLLMVVTVLFLFE